MKKNHILTVWFRLKRGTDTSQRTACWRVFLQPYEFFNIPCLSYSQECHWTHTQFEEPVQRLTQALVYTPEMLKIKAGAEQKATKEEEGCTPRPDTLQFNIKLASHLVWFSSHAGDML